ncbi:isoprenoid synthase domain-containing protein [Xylaria bambusicola]|uniref:isoprenoid synthase domain-containing protein n=1 Tax=Xylaria bambusicola TaxID=326684 RepID=UPI0020076E93|nr:isoprenoid synthase domain-containing protein [Xylaria bambusicola]KAI0526002.1 isoprenoid synthase domain-containing protein [Xylaria bambusicola]
MHTLNQKNLLAQRLSGQKLVVPDMRPIMSHWPCGQHDDYKVVKGAVEKRLAIFANEKHQKALSDADPALLAARWWPTTSIRSYSVMTDLVIWFGLWDDVIERLTDTTAAESLRVSTKKFIRNALSPTEGSSTIVTSNPLIQSFQPIADEARTFYNEDQLKILIGHFCRYIDATRLEAEAELSSEIPDLKEYWEVRILTSGMGTLLGLSEYSLQVQLPPSFVQSEAYGTLWVTTVVINSIINDLISLKKEMKAQSVVNSVAILFHQYNDLDIAVQMSLDHTRQLVDLFDRTATEVLSSSDSFNAEELDAIRQIIDLMRTVNTGNLEWSLQAQRYGVAQHITESGAIEVVL